MPIIPTPPGAVKVTAKRSPRSKTFTLPSGSQRLVQPIRELVHFESTPGANDWQDIDTSISFSSGFFRVGGAPYTIEMLPDAVGFNYTNRAGGSVEMRLVELSDTPIAALLLSIVPRIDGNKLWYDNIVGDLDIYFELKTYGVETWKVVKDSGAPHIVKWSIREEGNRSFRVNTVVEAKDNENRVPLTGSRAASDTKLWRFAEVDVTVSPKIRVLGADEYTIREHLTGNTAHRDSASRTRNFEPGKIIYPVRIDQDITESITTEGDDGAWDEGSSTWVTDDDGVHGFWNQYAGSGTNSSWPGYRFQTVNIPVGATIDTAAMSYTVDATEGTGMAGDLSADDVDDAPVFGNSSAPPNNSFTATTASGSMSCISTGATSVTLTSVVAEIVARGGWAANNDIRFGITNVTTGSGGSNSADVVDGGPQLTIDYTEGGRTTKNARSFPLGTQHGSRMRTGG